MDTLTDKTAVITGGASGIGLAMAERFAQDGMKLVLADIELAPLNKQAERLTADGHDVLAVACDVSDRGEVEALADATYERFGAAHVVCNNAGVVGQHKAWEDQDTWDWVLGVDLMGVVYGVNAFVSRMLAGGEEGHIVNTASVAGLFAFPGIASYNVAKHGVVALSQSLHFELAATPLGVSVLCPGLVETNIHNSDRNRPGIDPVTAAATPGPIGQESLSPAVVADQVQAAVRSGSFWVLPHPHYAEQAVELAQARQRGDGPILPRVDR